MNGLSSLTYNLAIRIYILAIHIISPFNKKANQFVNGRKSIFHKIEQTLKPNERRIWFHCASVGEFEQARPVIEGFRKLHPDFKIVLTFFSPSGFELRKDYSGADYIFYLPADTKANAIRFINIINPELTVFVKYEFWKNYLEQLKKRNLKCILIAGIFRNDQFFFKWYGKSFQSVLTSFTKLLVQNQKSVELLKSIGINQCALVNDTRIDRVIDISNSPTSFPLIKKFFGSQKVLVAGSTWLADIHLLSKSYSWLMSQNIKLIVVPHEISEKHISEINKKFANQTITESALNEQNCTSSNILIIDSVGKLSSVYAYANVAYVGGGFGKGIHNILEAAVYGIPVLFGPNHKKFNEATWLLEKKAAVEIKNADELLKVLQFLFQNENAGELGEKGREIILAKSSGTIKTIEEIEKLIFG